MTIDLSRLRAPLTTLWPDIQVPGLPMVLRGGRTPYVLAIHDGGNIYGVDVEHSTLATAVFTHCDWDIDLSRPGAIDILARRVSTALGEDCDPTPYMWCDEEACEWYMSNGPMVAELLQDLDPSDESRLDWGNLGDPRVVDFEALLLVAQHLSAQEPDQ